MPAGMRICGQCGPAVPPSASELNPPQFLLVAPERASPARLGSGKSRVTAGVLGILLGGLGVQFFYLGRTGLGILVLVLALSSALTIPAAIGLVHGILLLCMSDEEFTRKYCR